MIEIRRTETRPTAKLILDTLEPQDKPARGEHGATQGNEARRAQSMNNMKRIVLALLNYESAHKSFPPAYATDADDNPTVSWRVLILPYLEQQALDEKFKLDEPWDSPNNKPLSQTVITRYQSPDSKAKPGMATYLGVRGERAIFTGKAGTRLANVRDGMSNTIMVVEVNDKRAVPWAKPYDYEVDVDDPAAGLGGLRPQGFVAGMGDGSVQVIDPSIDKEDLKALFTRAGGEVIGGLNR